MTAVAMPAPHVHQLTQQFQQLMYQEEEENPKKVKLFKRAYKIKPCDGINDVEMKKWVRDVDKAYKSISGEPEREQWIITFIGLTVKGWFSRSLLEKIGKVQERWTWAYLRKVVVEELMEDAGTLRDNIRTLVQTQTESVYTYNQRYARDLPWAFENADLEQPLVQEFMVSNYLEGLREQDIVEKTLCEQPKTVADAMFAAEQAEYIANVIKYGCKYRTKKNTPKPYKIVSYRQIF